MIFSNSSTGEILEDVDANLGGGGGGGGIAFGGVEASWTED